jgi:hypothetical protein
VFGGRMISSPRWHAQGRVVQAVTLVKCKYRASLLDRCAPSSTRHRYVFGIKTPDSGSAEVFVSAHFDK